MSKYKSLLRRERIAAVAAEVVDQLARLLSLAGVTIRAKVQQSKRTGSVYLKIKVLTVTPEGAGEKLKDCGVAIRISDHHRPGSRCVNFSQPARRFYGIWFAASPWLIVGKVNRIGARILARLRRREEGGEA